MGVVRDGGKVDDQHGRLPPLFFHVASRNYIASLEALPGIFLVGALPGLRPKRSLLSSLQLFDALWAETRPVFTVYLYNWSLNITQRHDVVTCLRSEEHTSETPVTFRSRMPSSA